MKYLILTSFERELFELWLGRKIKEGDLVLGAKVMFMKRPTLEETQKWFDNMKRPNG